MLKSQLDSIQLLMIVASLILDLPLWLIEEVLQELTMLVNLFNLGKIITIRFWIAIRYELFCASTVAMDTARFRFIFDSYTFKLYAFASRSRPIRRPFFLMWSILWLAIVVGYWIMSKLSGHRTIDIILALSHSNNFFYFFDFRRLGVEFNIADFFIWSRLIFVVHNRIGQGIEDTRTSISLHISNFIDEISQLFDVFLFWHLKLEINEYYWKRFYL